MSNIRLLHPTNGQHAFGVVPSAKWRDSLFPSGNIYLPLGKHTGPNRGFGARHIWAEHAKEMRKAGLETEDDVPAYVARIVCARTPLYFEGALWTKIRLMAVRGVSGTAILELVEGRQETFWSVVTAYSANKKHGAQIGTVLEVAPTVAASP